MTKLNHVYSNVREMHEVIRTVPRAQSWHYRKALTSLRVGGTVYHADRLGLEDDDVRERVREVYQGNGGHAAPSSWGSVWRQGWRDRSPIMEFPEHLRSMIVGPWQYVPRQKVDYGASEVWDMKNAYYWSGTEGLPDPRTYRQVSRHWKVADVTVSPGPNAYGILPPPLRYDRPVRAFLTAAEIDLYDLVVHELHTGWSWRRDDGRRVLDRVDALVEQYGDDAGHRVMQSYWGAWIGEAVQCRSWRDGEVATAWKLPCRNDPIRASLVMARVRMELWAKSRQVTDPRRLYVDSIICGSAPWPDLHDPTPGQWRRKDRYRQLRIVDTVKYVGHL